MSIFSKNTENKNLKKGKGRSKMLVAAVLSATVALAGLSVAFAVDNSGVSGVSQSNSDSAIGGVSTNYLGKYDFLAPASDATIDIDLPTLAKRSVMQDEAMKPVILNNAFVAMQMNDDGSVPNQASNGYWYATLDLSGQSNPLRTQLNNDKYITFDGDLFYFIYKNAATLPDGSKANVKITYFDAYLVKSKGTDTTNQLSSNAKIALASGTRLLASCSDNNTNHRIGWRLKAKVQILDENDVAISSVKIDGKDMPATFYFPMVDIDVDRNTSQYATGVNSGLYDADQNGINRGFSEQVRIQEYDSGLVKDKDGNYVFIPGPGTTTAGTEDECYRLNIVEDTDEGLRFYNRSSEGDLSDADPGTYRTGFVAMVNNEKGITVTWWGSGFGPSNNLQTFICANGDVSPNHKARTVWHKITSSSGLGGTIQTTAYGNKDGRLNAKEYGNVLQPGTYLIPELRDSTIYTMTPDKGFEVAKIEISDTDIDGKEIAGTKTTVQGNDIISLMENGYYNVTVGTTIPKEVRTTNHNTKPGFSYNYDPGTEDSQLLYNKKTGVVTFNFPNNSQHHKIHVEWRQIPEVVNATKYWDDFENNYDTRKDVLFHIDVKSEAKVGGMTVTRTMKDVLPAQKLSAGASGSDLTKTWGAVIPYTPADSSETIELVENLPEKDQNENPILWKSHYTDNGLRYIGTSTYTETPVYVKVGTEGDTYPIMDVYLPRTDATMIDPETGRTVADDTSGNLVVYRKTGNTYSAYRSNEDADAGGTPLFQYRYYDKGYFQHTNGTLWKESQVPEDNFTSSTTADPTNPDRLLGEAMTNEGSDTERIFTTGEHCVNLLPRFDEDGGEIEYIIRETLDDGSDVVADDPTKGFLGYTTEVTEDTRSNTVITNNRVQQTADTQNYNVDNALETISEENNTDLNVTKTWLDEESAKKNFNAHTIKEIADSFKLYRNSENITNLVWDFQNGKSKVHDTDTLLTDDDNAIRYKKRKVYQRLSNPVTGDPVTGTPYTERIPAFRSADGQNLYYRDGEGGYVNENGDAVSLPNDAARLAFTINGDEYSYIFVRTDTTYDQVTTTDSTDNPSELEWYEKDGDNYKLTEDTSVDPEGTGKEYYTRTDTETDVTVKFKEYPDAWESVHKDNADYGIIYTSKQAAKTAYGGTLHDGKKYVVIKNNNDGTFTYRVEDIPTYVNIAGEIVPAVYFIKEDNDFSKTGEKYMEPSQSELDKAGHDGSVVNEERIIVEADKTWEDDKDELGKRRDVAFHIDAVLQVKNGSSTVEGDIRDVLPPMIISGNKNDETSAPEKLKAIWGNDTDYSARAADNNLKIYTVSELPKDQNGNAISYKQEVTEDGLRYIGYITYSEVKAFKEKNASQTTIIPELPTKETDPTTGTERSIKWEQDAQGTWNGTYTDDDTSYSKTYERITAYRYTDANDPAQTAKYYEDLPTKTQQDTKNNNAEYKLSKSTDGTTHTFTVSDGRGILPDVPHLFIVNKLPRYDQAGNEIKYIIRETLVDGSDVAANDPKSGLVGYTTAIDNWDEFDKSKDNGIVKMRGDVYNSLYTVGLVGLKVDKVLSGRGFTADDEFKFVLTAKNNTPMPVKKPVEIDDSQDAEEVVRTLSVSEGNVIADTVRGTVDFGVIAYNRSDLKTRNVTYNDNNKEPGDDDYLTDAELESVRYWTAKVTVQKENENGEKIYDDGSGNETTDATNPNTGLPNNPVMVDKDRVFDMKDQTDKVDFNDTTVVTPAQKKVATGQVVSNIFTYQIAETPQDGADGDSAQIKNDSDIEEIKVNVLYDQINRKILVSSKDIADHTQTPDPAPKFATGVDATVVKVTDRTKPKVYLEKAFFENEYTAKGTYTPKATKTLDGKNLSKDQFTFSLKAIDTPEMNADFTPKTYTDGGDTKELIDVEAADTPMPKGTDVGDTATADNGIKKYSIITGIGKEKGTGNIAGPVAFNDITYTTDDLLKTVTLDVPTTDQSAKGMHKASDAEKKLVDEWTWTVQKNDGERTYIYGSIPNDATAEVTVDGITKDVKYSEANDAQRKAAMGDTIDSKWESSGNTYIMPKTYDTTPETDNSNLIGTAPTGWKVSKKATGSYYLTERKFTYELWENIPGAATAKIGGTEYIYTQALAELENSSPAITQEEVQAAKWKLNGYTYDGKKYTIRVKVTDKKDGTVETKAYLVTTTSGGTTPVTETEIEDPDQLLFKNEYDLPDAAQVKATKVWDDNENAYKTRKDVTLHLDATYNKNGKKVTISDIRPAKTIAANASGDALTVTWGSQKYIKADARGSFDGVGATMVNALPTGDGYENLTIDAKDNGVYYIYRDEQGNVKEKYLYDSLFVKTDEGEEIKYTVREDDVSGYTSTIKEGDWEDNTPKTKTFTVTNKYKTIDLEGTKQWIDGGKAHDNATEVKLTVHYRYTDGENAEQTGTFDNAHIDWDKNNKNKFKVIGLPKVNEDGYEYTYWITENAVNGYDTTYDNSQSTADLTDAQKAATDKLYNGGKVINRIKQDAVEIEGQKKWVGGEADEHDNIGLNVTLYRQSAKPGAAIESGNAIKKVEQVGGGADARWQLTETSAAIDWTKGTSSTGNDSYKFKNLPKYDADGYEYTYWVVEGSVPTDYAVSYKNASGKPNAADKVYDDGTITNTSTRKDSIEVSKTWNDNKDAEGLRPTKVIVHLYKKVKDGQNDKTVQVEVESKEITGTAWNNITWTDLPVYDAEGNKIEYQVVEENEYGYTTTYTTKASPSDSDFTETDNKIKLDGNTGAQTVAVKNTLVPATSKVDVEKKWNDGDDVDGIRPDEVTVELYARVWDKTAGKYGDEQKAKRQATQADVDAADPAGSIELNDWIDVEQLKLKKTDNPAWKGSWTGLPSTRNGKTVLYSVKEVTSDGNVFGENKYDTNYVVTGDQVDGFKVTNTHKQLETTASITKSWVDKSNAYNTRPKKISLQLMRMYKDANGQDRKEAAVDINGESIKAETSADDEDSDSDTWKRTVKHLPKNILVTQTDGSKKSEKITYFWRETVPNDYTATGKDESDTDVSVVGNGSRTADIKDSTTVTNTITTGELTVIKTWSDEDDQDGIRDAAITQFKSNLKLYADGKEVTTVNEGPLVDADQATKSVTEEDSTDKITVVYKNIPVVTATGSSITYSVDEGVITGYGLTNSSTTSTTLALAQGETTAKGSLALVNEHVPGTTEIEVTKEWNDNNNADGKRPTIDQMKAALKLYADGAEKAGVTPDISINNDGTWTIKYSNLQAKKDKNNILYTVKEDKVNTAAGEDVASGFEYYEDGASYDNSGAKKTDYFEPTDAQKADQTQLFNGAKVTNKQMYRDLEVRNTWIDTVKDTSGNDISGHTGNRPDTITIKLTDAAGTVLKDANGDDLTKTVSTTDTTSKIKFEKVPIHKADGTTTETVKLAVNTDNKVPNYKTEIDQDKYEIINTYQIDKLSGTKTWIDGNAKHDNRKEVVLKLERTTETNPANFNTATWTEVTNESFVHLDWDGNTWTFANLPEKDKNGNVYTYRVIEDIAAVRTNTGNVDYKVTYTNTGAYASLTGDAAKAAYKGGTIKNKLEKNEIRSGTKTWINGDDDDHDNTVLGLKLYRESVSNGGSVTREVVRGAEITDGMDELTGDTTYYFGRYDPTESTFTREYYPKYDDQGYEYVYTVGDETGYPDGYTPSYDGMDTTNTFNKVDAKITPKFVKKAVNMPQDVIDAGGKTFTFLLAPQTNTAAIATDDLDKEQTVTVTGNGDTNQVTFDFGEMTFTEPGTYTYKLVEKLEDGWICSSSVNRFQIKVTDNNGTLSAAIEWPQDADIVTDGNKLRVTNTYDPKAVVSALEVEKTLSGRNLKAEEFNFSMQGLTSAEAGAGYEDASSMTSAGTNKKAADGAAADVEMSAVSFNKEGKYMFEVKENIPAKSNKLPGIEYDDKLYRTVATVKGNDKGVLSVTWKIVAESTDGGYNWTDIAAVNQKSKASFANSYSGSIEDTVRAKKILEGRKLKADEFDIILAGDSTADGDDSTIQSKKNAAGTDLDANKKSVGTVTFDKIKFTLEDFCDHDGSYIGKQADGSYKRTFTYKVYEKPGAVNGVSYDPAVHELVATLEWKPSDDNDHGTMDLSWKLDGTDIDFSSEFIEFNNKYNAKAVSSAFTDVKKLLSVPAGQNRSLIKDEFLFEILDSTGKRVALGSNGESRGVTGDSNDREADVTFAPITFTEDMITTWRTDNDGSVTGSTGAKYGELTYTIKEIEGNNKDDLEYSNNAPTLKAVVYDTGNGELNIKWVKPDGQNYTFKNEVSKETVDKPVRVTWVYDTEIDKTVGKDGVSKERPEEVYVTLQQKSGAGNWKDTADPSDSNKSWTIKLDKTKAKEGDPDNWFDEDTFKDLPKYDASGNEITYRVVQTGYKLEDGTKKNGVKTNGLTAKVTVPGYSTSSVVIKLTGDLETILNVYEVTVITGTKTWIDPNPDAHNNSHEIKFKVERSADGNTWKEVKEGEDYHIDWRSGNKPDDTFAIIGLVKYVDVDANPEVEYQYRVTEKSVGSGYDTKYFKADGSTETTGFESGGVIKNIIKQTKRDVKVTKKWVGAATDDVTIQLWSNAGGSDGAVSGKTVVIAKNDNSFGDEGGSKEHTFSNLDRYDLDPSSANYGKEIVYTVKETPAGNSNFTTTDPAGSMKDGYTITNVNKETVDVYAQKHWAGDADAKENRSDVDFKLIQTIDGAKKDVADYTTEVGGAEKEIKGTQTIPANKTVDVNTDAGTISWPNLPKFDKDGNKITYTVEEVSAPAGYGALDVTGEGTETKPYVITNKLGENMVTIPVMKKWDDNKDQDGKRPDSVEVFLMRDDKRVKDGSDNEVKIVLNDDNNWKSAFKDLPAMDDTGKKYVYTVEEKDITGYQAKYEYGNTTDNTWNTTKPGNWNNKIRITNTYVPGKTEIKATKEWAGEGSVGKSMRQDAIFHLYGTYDGMVVYDAGTKKVDKDASSKEDRTVKWTNIPARHFRNDDLEWMVVEDAMFGYKTSVTGNKTEGFTVTNTYGGAFTTIKAEKVWDDDGISGDRPDSVTFELWRKVGDNEPEKVDGKDKVVNASGDWKTSWTDLPATSEEITGTGTVTSQRQERQHKMDNGKYLYKNLADGTTVAVAEADKPTYDANTAEYEPVMETVTVTDKKDETKSVPVLYSVKEKYSGTSLMDKGYKQPLVEAVGPGEFKVHNIRENVLINVNVKKVWNDDNDADGIRPDHITLRLMNGDKEVRKAVVTEDDEWEHVFMNVPKYANSSSEIKYTVKEDEIKGYTASVSQTSVSDDGTKNFAVTNTHTKGALYDVSVTKEWKDDKAENRKAVELTLMKKIGEGDDAALKKVKDAEVKTIPANAEGADLTVTWKNMPSTENGKTVVYTVKENEIDGYKSTVSDTTVDNEKLTMAITVTNEYQKKDEPTPTPSDGDKLTLIYVDPAAKDAKMILKSIQYGTAAEIQAAAKKLAGKPGDPKHSKLKFIEWVANTDKFGNVVMVAKYSQVPTVKAKVVSYLDGQSKNSLLVSKVTDDESSVKKPNDPNHNNMRFVGWKKVTDDNGNVFYLAQYKADCANNGGGSTEPKDKQKVKKRALESTPGAGATPGQPKGFIPPTGDEVSIWAWILLMIAAGTILIVFAAGKRKERQNQRL